MEQKCVRTMPILSAKKPPSREPIKLPTPNANRKTLISRSIVGMTAIRNGVIYVSTIEKPIHTKNVTPRVAAILGCFNSASRLPRGTASSPSKAGIVRATAKVASRVNRPIPQKTVFQSYADGLLSPSTFVCSSASQRIISFSKFLPKFFKMTRLKSSVFQFSPLNGLF